MKSRIENLSGYTHIFASVLFCAMAIHILVWAKAELILEKNFHDRLARIHIVIPNNTPDITQESLDFAMMAFGIRSSSSISGPTLDLDLEDRGLTTRGTLSDITKITIGPAAFSDWPILASTLAHEIEVHGRQNFMIIWILDSIGFDGTGIAERQAYRHEIINASRFGLDPEDRNMIADTMEYYYPEGSNAETGAKVAKKVKMWFAKNILREKSGF